MVRFTGRRDRISGRSAAGSGGARPATLSSPAGTGCGRAGSFTRSGPSGGAGGGARMPPWSSCYRRCLEVAAGAGARSVAFPAISTGAFGFPEDRAAEIAVREVSRADPAAWDRIVLVAFERRTYALYRSLLAG